MRESSLLNGSLQNKALRGVLWGVHAEFACILAVTRLGRVLSGVRTSKRRDAKVPTNADTSSKAHSCPPDPHNVGRKSGIQRFDRPISDSCTGNGRKRAYLGRFWSGRDSIRPTLWLASLLSGMIKSCRSTIHETTCKEKQLQRRASGEDGWLSFWRRHGTVQAHGSRGLRAGTICPEVCTWGPGQDYAKLSLRLNAVESALIEV